MALGVAKSCRLLLQQNNDQSDRHDDEIKRDISIDGEDHRYRGLSYFLNNADSDVVNEQPQDSKKHHIDSRIKLVISSDSDSEAKVATELEEEWDPMASERDDGEFSSGLLDIAVHGYN